MSKPTVGRIVHYVLADGATIRPAIILEVNSEHLVGLQLFLAPEEERNMQRFHFKAPYSPTGQPRTWHWPQATH